MKRKFRDIFLLFPACTILLFLVSCGPAELAVTGTPTLSATFEVTATPVPDTATPVCTFPCFDDSLTVTAVMGETQAANPSLTPPAGATIVPLPGDLGWGAVYGKIIDGLTSLPLEGATVTCEHFSYKSPYLCKGVTTTNSDGIYSFVPVYFRDTDRITLIVEAPGYITLRFEQAFFTQPEFHADLGLFPLTDGTITSTPFIIICTPPPCSDGVLVCGEPGGCLAGCGAVCLPATPTP